MVPRKPVPEPWRTQLIAVTEALRTARSEREALIVQALRAGGSIREIAELVGMNHRQVLEIGHNHGWPPADERERRRQDRQRAAAERKLMAEIRRSAEFQQALERYEKDPDLERFEDRKSWWRDVMDGDTGD